MNDTVASPTPRKRGRPHKTEPGAAPAEVQPNSAPRKRAPRLPVAVLERRIQNPFGIDSVPIALKEDGWTVYWCNTTRSADRLWHMKQRGWTDVLESEVADHEQLGTYTVQGGVVCRGERGQERLMKMPTADYKRIQWAKTERNFEMMRRGMGKDAVAQAAAQKFGDQAGEFIGKAHMTGTVVDKYERVHREEGIE